MSRSLTILKSRPSQTTALLQLAFDVGQMIGTLHVAVGQVEVVVVDNETTLRNKGAEEGLASTLDAGLVDSLVDNLDGCE